MIYTQKFILKFIFLFSFAIIYSQSNKSDSLRGNFTYLLKAKSNLITNNIYEELFSLQISDERTFFISEQNLKFDSIFLVEFHHAILNSKSNDVDFRGKSFPKSSSNFMIIQTNNNIQFYGMVGMQLFSYNDPIINDWKLINESKTINSIICKKAEISFKGRDWIAWYSNEIPFPHGPYKFSGLPGLIIDIRDKKGDYSFELVKSSQSSSLKGKIITIDKSRYEHSKLTTKKELENAKENFRKNYSNSLENIGVQTTIEQKEDMRQRQKKDEILKKGYNPIELSD